MSIYAGPVQDLIDNDFIYSKNAVNFLIEIPDISLFAGVCFQRLFNSILSEELGSITGKRFKMKGDDILLDVIEKRKASVSIAKSCNGTVLIHTGINIEAGERAPDFAYSTAMSEMQSSRFMKRAEDRFYETTQDIFTATCKII